MNTAEALNIGWAIRSQTHDGRLFCIPFGTNVFEQWNYEAGTLGVTDSVWMVPGSYDATRELWLGSVPVTDEFDGCEFD